MPAIALVAAIGTVSAGAALGGVLGGVMIAGGVMTGLGAITGNKTLMKIGAIASLGAGIGSMMGLSGAANGAWNAATAGNEALQVTGKSFFADGGVFGAAGSAADSGLTAMRGGVGQTTGLPDTSGLGDTALPTVGNNPSAYAPPTGVINSTPPGTSPSSWSQAPSPGTTAVAQPGALPGAAQVQSAMSKLPANASALEKAIAFAKDNPELVKVGSGLMAGGMTGYSEQKKLDAQQAQIAERRKAYNDSILGQRRVRS